LYRSFTQNLSVINRSQNGKKASYSTRLSILTQYYPPDYAATGQLIEELAHQLGRQGMKVHIFTGQPGYAFGQQDAPTLEEDEHLSVRRSRTTRILSQRIRGKAINGIIFCLRAGLHLLKTASRGDVLLVTTAPPFLPLLGYVANLCFGVPYVCLIYDLYPDVAVELKVVSRTHKLVRLWNHVNRLVWRRAKSVIVLSPSMKQRVLAQCPDITERVAVIHSWADPHHITPIPKEENWFAHQHNLVKKFCVLYSGNMGRCHDIDTIIATAQHLKDEPIKFVFIGNGAKYQACQEQARILGLNQITFLPYQDKECLPYSLTACDLSLVSISPGMEGLVAPSKLYGILAAGRPVAAICEPHSYLRQMLSEVNFGKAFDNGDSEGLAQFIRELAANREQAEFMGCQGRRYLETHFTPERIAQQYGEVLTVNPEWKLKLNGGRLVKFKEF